MTITCNLYTNGQWHDAEGHATFTAIIRSRTNAPPLPAPPAWRMPAAAPLRRRGVPAVARYGTAERRRLLLEAAEEMLRREAEFIAAMAAETEPPRTGPVLTFI
ncbi:MAG: hypothetical protein ACLR17_04670 [Enterobacteriaceae bacterium]